MQPKPHAADPGEAPGPSADGDMTRLIGRLSTDYLLRSLRLVADAHDGDLLLGVISAAIVSANTAHLRPEESARYSALDSPPDDDARRPVSINALAGMLGLPFETTRRRVMTLIERGVCERRPNGVIIRTSVLASARNREILSANEANLRRLLRGLGQAGVSLD